MLYLCTMVGVKNEFCSLLKLYDIQNKTIIMKHFLIGIVAMLSFFTTCCAQSDLVRSLNVAQFEKYLSESHRILLDVRTPKEYSQGHLQDAVNVDVSSPNFADQIKAMLPQGQEVAVYCRSGKRSKNAAKVLSQMGLRVVELDRGISDWMAKGKPVTNEEVDMFTTQHGICIWAYCIKHGSVKLRIADKWVYVDPVAERCLPYTDYSTMPKADYIVITHDHYDHLDTAAIRQLYKQDTRIISNYASLQSMPTDVKCSGMRNGEMLTTESFTLKAVPAYNYSANKQQFHAKGVGNGYILTIDGFTIYIAGDTEDIIEMFDLGNVDVAFLPCNLPFTMTPEQLAFAAKKVSPKVLFPYHYGDTDVNQMLQALKEVCADVRIRNYQ